MTAGAIRSWQAEGKQDDERVTGKGEGGLAQGLPSAVGATLVRGTPGEEGSITHLPRSKGALPPGDPVAGARSRDGAGGFMLSLLGVCWCGCGRGTGG